MTDADLPVAVHVRDPKGYDLYIGRRAPRFGLYQGSKWENPYPLASADRATVLALYERYVRNSPALMAALPELRGLRLGCWCAKPGQVLTADDPLTCHGQVLGRLLREVMG